VARSTALLAAARAARGFMPEDEGVALHLAARRAAASGLGPLVEVGAYLGRSTLLLAAAIVAVAPVEPVAPVDPLAVTPGAPDEPGSQARWPMLYSVDHHHGSEEMQAGWEHHDPTLVDPATGVMDTLGLWRATLQRAGAEDLVTAIVGDSPSVASDWGATVSFVLLDGGHGRDVAWADYRGWSRHVALGGLLVIHDVFPDPADGGRPPYECYVDALSGGCFVEERPASRKSLRVLRRIAPAGSAQASKLARSSLAAASGSADLQMAPTTAMPAAPAAASAPATAAVTPPTATHGSVAAAQAAATPSMPIGAPASAFVRVASTGPTAR
jgi:hypothetical protein